MIETKYNYTSSTIHVFVFLYSSRAQRSLCSQRIWATWTAKQLARLFSLFFIGAIVTLSEELLSYTKPNSSSEWFGKLVFSSRVGPQRTYFFSRSLAWCLIAFHIIQFNFANISAQSSLCQNVTPPVFTRSLASSQCDCLLDLYVWISNPILRYLYLSGEEKTS